MRAAGRGCRHPSFSLYVATPSWRTACSCPEHARDRPAAHPLRISAMSMTRSRRCFHLFAFFLFAIAWSGAASADLVTGLLIGKWKYGDYKCNSGIHYGEGSEGAAADHGARRMAPGSCPVLSYYPTRGWGEIGDPTT